LLTAHACWGSGNGRRIVISLTRRVNEIVRQSTRSRITSRGALRRGGFSLARRLLTLILVLLPMTAAAAPRHVTIPEPGGVRLQALLYLPSGPQTAPGIVALHGCGGPLPRRDDGWARRLAGQGHAVLLPDSFASRGLAPECRQTTHGADAYGPRRADALAAAAWLAAQAGTPPGGILLLGWSDGGTTVLASIAAAPDLPPHLLRGAVAFYPACTRTVKNPAWQPTVPLLILMGAADDWTPPAPCQELAARHPSRIKLVLYPAAYHDFDVPDDPVHLIHGLPYTKYGTGIAHAGENPAARAAALAAVPNFYATLTTGH
jgi:dienelactone hydrolase